MIIEHENNIMKHWNDSGKQLMIKAKAGNGSTNMAKMIMNQMIKEDYSILLLTDVRSTWAFGLDKSEKTLVGPYKGLSGLPEKPIEIDLLVIDRLLSNGPIENVKYKYILVLSDESNWTPSYFKGEIVRIIDWNNISNIVFGENKMVYKVTSDYEGKISLKMYNPKNESVESIELPVSVLEELLLHHKKAKEEVDDIDEHIRK